MTHSFAAFSTVWLKCKPNAIALPEELMPGLKTKNT
jgi:hypothetical protein